MKQNKRTAGFTLVELIVVIAIMGILAGVGTVGYSGYIKMARESADNQILAAVNTAFASACLESQIELGDVETATISIENQKVYGLSTVADKNSKADIAKIGASFDNYYQGNSDAVFKTENVNSLAWNKDKGTFEMKADFTALRVTLGDGRVVTISAEDLAAVRDSTFATMGLAGVTQAMDDINASAELLAGIVAPLGKFDRLSAALVANGYMTAQEAAAIEERLKKIPVNLGPLTPNYESDKAAYDAAKAIAANGLQMCVAEYVAGANETQIQNLMNIDLGSNSATGMVSAMSNHGGTVGSSALAMQYGVAQSFANSSYADGTIITEGRNQYTVSEYLASTEDPVKAINKIKGTAKYQEYAASEQYTKDVNGLAGTFGVVGDNIGNDNIDTDAYLNNGIESDDAQSVLGALLNSAA